MDKYFDEIRPNLSTQSKKLYGKQLEKVFIYSKMKKFEPLKLTIRIVNQSIKNKNLDMIILEEGGLQSQNQRLSAFRNMLENNEKDIPKIKYDKVSKMITDKEINMIPWENLTEFVENMSDNTKMELRNKLILNLMINNYKVIDNQKYNVLLRVIEYQTLNLWTNKKPPPNDKENYLWLKELPILYIQHSKTIGGVKRVGNESVEQVKLKTFPISKNVIEILKKYIKEFKIKNKNILFFGPDGEVMKNPYFRNILTTELKTLAPNITSTIIRKIYENKEITLKNANDKMIFNKLVDHSMAIAEVFYHKN